MPERINKVVSSALTKVINMENEPPAFGYMGKLLRVDLTRRRATIEKIQKDICRKFIGGTGLGAWILFNEVRPKSDPLGPKNKLIIATGPLTGTAAPSASRYVAIAKSPLTGIWGEAHAAGFFGPELKFAGYDAVVFEGQADEPVYLWLRDDNIEIKDAKHLWGKKTNETEAAIKKEANDNRVKIACIGPAGENLVKTAAIINDSWRAAGRCGLGAVAGSKKLKAIAVRGTKRVNVFDHKALRETVQQLVPIIQETKREMSRFGTSGGTAAASERGTLPTKNFSTGVFEGANKITGETMAAKFLIGKQPCFSCPVSCGRIVEVKGGDCSTEGPTGGPEYESVAALGSLCCNDNLESVIKANQLCNEYGLDTISTGCAIAFAMECFEKNLIGLADTDGIELAWGNCLAVIAMIPRIALRKGFGNLLAEGVRVAAQKIGHGADEFIIQVKGMEIPMYEVRGRVGDALALSTSNRGGCHLRGTPSMIFKARGTVPEVGITAEVAAQADSYSWNRMAEFTKKIEDAWAVLDSLVVCKFNYLWHKPITLTQTIKLISSVTGWDMNVQEFMKTGERICNLEKAFNVREGLTREDDVFPSRFEKPMPEGASKGHAITRREFNQALDEYYQLRGWNSRTGQPTRGKLEELDLKNVADELKL